MWISHSFIILLYFILLCVCSLSCVLFFVIPRTVTHKAPLSIGLSKQGSWSGLPFPPPEDLLNLKIEPLSPVAPVLASGLFITELPRKPIHTHTHTHTHTQRQHCSKSHFNTLITPWNFQSPINFLFFFPVLSLVQYSVCQILRMEFHLSSLSLFCIQNTSWHTYIE